MHYEVSPSAISQRIFKEPQQSLLRLLSPLLLIQSSPQGVPISRSASAIKSPSYIALCILMYASLYPFIFIKGFTGESVCI